MAKFRKGDIVTVNSTGSYDLPKTRQIIQDSYPDKRHASTTTSIGDVIVEQSDEEGALVSFKQNNYPEQGYLYYPNKCLDIVKRLEPEVINNFPIF